MKQGFVATVAVLGISTAWLLSTPAIAQEAETEQPAAETDQNPWRKLCVVDEASQKQVCITRQEARNEEGQPIAAVSVRVTEGVDTPNMLFELPTGVVLPPGVQFQVDEDGEPRKGVFVICTPQFCSAEAQVDQAFIDEMKRGGNLILQVVNHTEEVVGVGFTLIGFTAAHESDGQNLADYQEGRQRVQEGLQERAEQARQQLQGQQEGEGAPSE